MFMCAVEQYAHDHEDACRWYSQNHGQAVSNRDNDISSKTRPVDRWRSSLTCKREADDNSLIRRLALHPPCNEVAEEGHDLGTINKVSEGCLTTGAATEKSDEVMSQH